MYRLSHANGRLILAVDGFGEALVVAQALADYHGSRISIDGDEFHQYIYPS